MKRSVKKCHMEKFLEGVLTGAAVTRKRELAHANAIQEAIFARWKVKYPEQLQNKHLRWFLEVYQCSTPLETRYRYWLTVIKIMKRRQKEADWTPRLKGPWTTAQR